MRVYISVDMEGVAGVVHEDQTDPLDPRHAGEYNRFRSLMTGEANADSHPGRPTHPHPERSDGPAQPATELR
jgi:hypothetical protein